MDEEVVGFGADEEDEARHINPDHEDDEGGESAVEMRVIAEMSDVEIEAQGCDDESEGNEQRPGSEPAPAAAAVGQKKIDQIDANAHENESCGPAEQFERDAKEEAGLDVSPKLDAGPAAEGENAETGDEEESGDQSSDDSDEALVPEAARFLQIIGDGERFHEADEAGRGGPDGAGEADGEETLVAVSEVDDSGEDKSARFGRKIVCDPLGEAVPKIGGRQPADEGRDDKKKGQQRQHEIKGHHGSEVEEIIVLRFGADCFYKVDDKAQRAAAFGLPGERTNCVDSIFGVHVI